MRKLIYILFIQLHVVFVHAAIFNDTTERDRFIEEAVIALDKKYAHNLELEQNGSTTAADYVVDIRNIKHRNAHTLVGLDLTALNTELANIKATYSNEGVAVYVLLSTAQPHLMTNATDGYTDNTYFDQYLNQAKSMTRDQWNSLPQTQFDRVYANYKTELARITREIIDRSQLGIQTKKGALLHLFDHVSISKSSPSSALSVKLIYTPVIALGQDLKAASMQSMLTYINERTSSFAFSNPSKLYDPPVESTNGVINPYVVILKAAFAQLMSDSFVADENNLSMDAKLVNYRQPLDMTRVINGLNNAPINPNPTPIVKIDNGVTYTVIDYAGIISADGANFWTEFLKTSDINNGIGIKEINAEIAKVNYYIIITSDKNKHDEKVATQLVVESSFNNTMPNTILVGMHFRNNQTSHDLPVQYTCKYSSQLATRITSLRTDNGYTWYRNSITGEIVLGKQLAYTQSDGGLSQATDWKPLGLSASVNSSGQIVYTQYVRYPLIDYVLRGIDKSFNALDEYMMENGEVVGSIIIEGAVIGATGGASLLFTGGRIIAYHAVTKISLEVTKGAAIAYGINVGLNMITTDFEMSDAGYNNDIFSKGVDVTGVITAGIEEIYRDESSKALINCVGGFSSAAMAENVRFLDLPEGCLRNVTTYYLTARLFGSGGAANIVVNKLKTAYAKNPIRFITRLKGYFNFTNDQVKALLTKLGISNDGVVDNLGRLVLATGRQYSKEALFIITKASTITNEVIGGSWKFYTTASKSKVFAEINTNGDLIIKDFSAVNFTGSTDDIIRSANYTNPAGQIETGDIAFVTNSNGTSGITKKVVSGTTNLAWIDDLVNLLPSGSKTQITSWITNGLDATKLKTAFNTSADKTILYNKLNLSKGINHQRAIIGDYNSISGVTQGSFVSNAVADVNSNILKNADNKQFTMYPAQAKTFVQNASLSVRNSIEVIEDLGNGIQFIKIKPGTKIYRVFDGYKPWDDISMIGNTLPNGSFWTFEKPTVVSDVIEGTAVMPEWNGMTKIIEIEVPLTGLFGWYGKAATQPASSTTSSFYLQGGEEQIIINFGQNQQSISSITTSITFAPWIK